MIQCFPECLQQKLIKTTITFTPQRLSIEYMDSGMQISTLSCKKRKAFSHISASEESANSNQTYRMLSWIRGYEDHEAKPEHSLFFVPTGSKTADLVIGALKWIKKCPKLADDLLVGNDKQYVVPLAWIKLKAPVMSEHDCRTFVENPVAKLSFNAVGILPKQIQDFKSRSEKSFDLLRKRVENCRLEAKLQGEWNLPENEDIFRMLALLSDLCVEPEMFNERICQTNLS